MLSYNSGTETRSFYIHWPFCPYKCHFCPFVAFSGQDHQMAAYHKALVSEVNEFYRVSGKRYELDTLYFGGGTPSTYPDDLLLDLFGILKEHSDLPASAEVTVEVNPGTVRPEQLGLWKQLGINRLSVGVQALKDSVLHSLNRHQSLSQVYDLLATASPLFENISIDMILGLPGVSPREWKDMIREVVTWPISHISLYFLTVHEDTPLYFRMKRGDFVLPKDKGVVELYQWSREYFEEHGFAQYELSSFSRVSSESRHNTVYWDRKPYRGFGVGACSFDGSSRFRNVRDLKRYIGDASAGECVVGFSEKLTDDQVQLERVMLGLRRPGGVAYDDVCLGLSDEQRAIIDDELLLLRDASLLHQRDGQVMLTPNGLVVENEVTARLFRVRDM